MAPSVMSEPRTGNSEAGAKVGNEARVSRQAASEAEDVRPLKVETLKARIGASAYEVDPGEVAAAMLRRPETRLWLFAGGRRSPGERPDHAK